MEATGVQAAMVPPQERTGKMDNLGEMACRVPMADPRKRSRCILARLQANCESTQVAKMGVPVEMAATDSQTQ
jgi:hypothetical protein